MEFKDFIHNLNKEDKNIYEKYSEIRGFQQYKIIFETLKRKDPNVSFKDVNSFIIFDKAIKDVLFKYLGTLEEYIRNDVILRFDFAPNEKIVKEEYHYFKQLPKCIRKNNQLYEITEFYKRFALNFGDLVSFLGEYDHNTYNISLLKNIVDLRNDVMHHTPLLFSFNFESLTTITLKRIDDLISMLPDRYKKGCLTELKNRDEITRKSISKSYYSFLLFDEGDFNV